MGQFNFTTGITGIIPQDLGDGQLAATKGTLYTCPASTTTIVGTITLVNTDTSARTVNLYLKRDGTNSRRIIPKDLSLAADGGTLIFDDGLTLEAADLVEGDASVASKVDYTISGVEKS